MYEERVHGKGRVTEVLTSGWCLGFFLLLEVIGAALLAFYVIYPCSWPLSQREACVSKDVDSFCSTPPCLRKCCQTDQELFKNGSSPSICRNTNNTNPLWMNYDNYTIFSKGMCSHGMYLVHTLSEHELPNIRRDGSLVLPGTNDIVPMDEFCLDSYSTPNSIKVFLCFNEEMQESVECIISPIVKVFYPFVQLMSLCLLVATMVVYLLVSQLKSLQVRCLLSYVLSLILSFTILPILHINFYNINNYRLPCSIAGFMSQFSFLASFFWSNVLCFYIWRVSRNSERYPRSGNDRGHTKFTKYCLYAWGGPILIVAFSVFMDTASFVSDDFIKPHIGKTRCWFRDKEAQILYFYLPGGVLILMNVVMFVATAVRIHVQTRGIYTFEDSRSQCIRRHKRFNIYLHLFIISGINWVADLVVVATDGSSCLWLLSDLINNFQGVILFFAFVWKRRILRKLKRRLCPKEEKQSASSMGRESRTSSTSRTSSYIKEEMAM